LNNFLHSYFSFCSYRGHQKTICLSSKSIRAIVFYSLLFFFLSHSIFSQNLTINTNQLLSSIDEGSSALGDVSVSANNPQWSISGQDQNYILIAPFGNQNKQASISLKSPADFSTNRVILLQLRQ